MNSPTIRRLFPILIVLFFVSAIQPQDSNFGIKTTLEEAYGKIPYDYVTGGSVTGSWSMGANLIPSARYYAASATYMEGDNVWVYVIGGDTTGGGVPTSTCVRYHLNSNTWSYIAPLPQPLRIAAATTAGNKIYVFGGLNAPGNVPPVANAYMYDIATDQWSSLPDMPEGLFFHRAVTYEDSIIYIIGGVTPTQRALGNQVFNFGLTALQWRDATNLPEPTGDGGAAIKGDKIYYFGGYKNDTETFDRILEGQLNRFESTYIGWNSKGIIPGGGRARINAYPVNSIIIVGGGSATNQFDIKSDWYQYAPDANTCTPILGLNYGRTAYMGGYNGVQSRELREINVVITGGVTFGPSLSVITEIYTDTIEVLNIEPVDGALPNSFRLEQNYPNPFNPATTIRFEIPEASNVKIKIFDVLGNEVKTLVHENMSAGTYEAAFMAGDLASGVYVYTLITENFATSKSMILLK